MVEVPNVIYRDIPYDVDVLKEVEKRVPVDRIVEVEVEVPFTTI